MKLSLYRRVDASIVALHEMFLPPGEVDAAGPYVFLGSVRTNDAILENELLSAMDRSGVSVPSRRGLLNLMHSLRQIPKQPPSLRM
jgi:hypothetical protein